MIHREQRKNNVKCFRELVEDFLSYSCEIDICLFFAFFLFSSACPLFAAFLSFLTSICMSQLLQEKVYKATTYLISLFSSIPSSPYHYHNHTYTYRYHRHKHIQIPQTHTHTDTTDTYTDTYRSNIHRHIQIAHTHTT